jgi:Tfp pilus assembly ATPase PilU
VKTWQLEKNAGKVEREAQNILENYKVEKNYIHSGELHSTKELFECSVQEALYAVKKAMEHYK